MAQHRHNQTFDASKITRLIQPHQNASEIYVRNGSVKYMDGRTLNRPLSLPKQLLPILGVILVVAIIISFVMYRNINYNVVHSSDRTSESVQQVINRGVTQDVPVLTGWLWCSYEEDIYACLDDSSFSYVNMNEINGSIDTTVDVFKLPSDMTYEESEKAFTKGISSLDSETAAKLLSGSWRMTVILDDGISYTVKYADFSSSSPESAVQAAIQAQGLSEAEVTDSGVDSNGNTYTNGTVSVDDETWSWTVSACNINNVYDVVGLPEDAQYVGVRIYR